MTSCEACEAIRKVGPSLLPHLTLADNPLCGFHASERTKERDEARAALDAILKRQTVRALQTIPEYIEARRILGKKP